MAKIFYGNGECEIQGEDIIYCELIVKYPIGLDDKSGDGFIIKARNNKIIIARFPLDKTTQLKEMFSYIGELNIISATVLNKNGDKELPIIKRVMDYTELLTTNAEDMTTVSENLKATHVHRHKIGKMTLRQPYIENMTTDNNNFYLEDGNSYSGLFHINNEDGSFFTEATHTSTSLPLYFKDIYEGDIREELILYNYKNLKNTRVRRTFGKKIRRRK